MHNFVIEVKITATDEKQNDQTWESKAFLSGVGEDDQVEAALRDIERKAMRYVRTFLHVT